MTFNCNDKFNTCCLFLLGFLSNTYGKGENNFYSNRSIKSYFGEKFEKIWFLHFSSSATTFISSSLCLRTSLEKLKRRNFRNDKKPPQITILVILLLKNLRKPDALSKLVSSIILSLKDYLWAEESVINAPSLMMIDTFANKQTNERTIEQTFFCSWWLSLKIITF